MDKKRFSFSGKQYEALLTLKREGSFRAAAEALGVSQPSLSQQIGRMESELGMPLFRREGRGVIPTDAGRILLRCGQKIHDLEEHTGYALHALCGEGAPLRIGTTPYRALTILPEAVRQFRQEAPDTPIYLEEMVSAELREALQRDQVELAFTVLPQTGGEDADRFTCRPILRERLILAVPEALPFAGSRLQDAAGLPFATLGEGQLLRRKLERLCAEAGFVPEIGLCCTDVQTLARLCAVGCFAAVLPEGILRERDRVRVIPIPERDENLREIGVLTRKGRALSPSAERFIGILSALGDRA